MFIIDNLRVIIKKWIAYSTHQYVFDDRWGCTFYLKYIIAVSNYSLLTLIFLFILNFISYLLTNTDVYYKVLVRCFNLFLITGLYFLFSLKFYFNLKLEGRMGIDLLTIKVDFSTLNPGLGVHEHYCLFSTAFGDGIIMLCFSVGLICIELLGPKNFNQTMLNYNVFYIFLFFIIVMCTTTNLLLMFLSFEFTFIPTVYFAYNLGYTKKIDNASKMLICWTLLGSFLILSNLSYLFYQYDTLSYVYLAKKPFTKQETYLLLFNFLFGFGVKIPLAPLHYWLLKVHVESPTAFSIYLSGFLVKSALYCMYMFICLFDVRDSYLYLLIWILYSLILSTLGFSRQTDIKKLIAWATVQEMSLILLFLIFKQLSLTYLCILFTLLHGLLSSYMFFLVDVIQRRFKTRALKHIKGVNLLFPELSKYIWFLILLFTGFPFTVKFFIEWSLISILLETHQYILILVLTVVTFLGVVFFCKIFFTILYGTPETKTTELEFFELQRKEKIVFSLILFFTFSLLLLMYFINWLLKENLLIKVYDELNSLL